MFKKTLKTQNKKAKLTMATLFIFGVAFLLLSPQIKGRLIVQTVGFLLIGGAVYIATAFVLKEYTVNVFIPDGQLTPDLAIFEFHGKREIKVCHIGLNEVTEIKLITPENAKAEKENRKNLKRYKYNTFFDCERFIELIVRDEISIMITFDPELYEVIKDNLTNI